MLLKFAGAARPLEGSTPKDTDRESPTVDSDGFWLVSDFKVKLKRRGLPTVLPIMMSIGSAAAYSALETNRTPLMYTSVTTMALAEAVSRPRTEKTEANRFIKMGIFSS